MLHGRRNGGRVTWGGPSGLLACRLGRTPTPVEAMEALRKPFQLDKRQKHAHRCHHLAVICGYAPVRAAIAIRSSPGKFLSSYFTNPEVLRRQKDTNMLFVR